MAITQTDSKDVAKIVTAMELAERYTIGDTTLVDFLQNFVDAYEVINDLTNSNASAAGTRRVIEQIKARSKSGGSQG